MIPGLLLVIFVGFLQGTFILPMTYTKEWKWEHNWLAFSFLGMLVLNLLIAVVLIPQLPEIFQSAETSDLLILLLFGFGWGAGAILFGIGMDRLGMGLGYPIIMGLNACAGSLIPAIIFSPEVFTQTKGIILIFGAAITLVGLIFCAKAFQYKTVIPNNEDAKSQKTSKSGLIIALIAGLTSCLPNLGSAFSSKITAIALSKGVPDILAGNAVWSLFFTAGCICNILYCLYLIRRGKSFPSFTNKYAARNWLLIGAMSAIWIGSFYFYGLSISFLGKFGLVIGWPIFISLSIIIGNLWGLKRGEWKEATEKSKRLMLYGIATLVFAVMVFAISNIDSTI